MTKDEIKEIRTQARLTLPQTAKLGGVNYHSYWRLESGLKQPRGYCIGFFRLLHFIDQKGLINEYLKEAEKWEI